MVPGERSSKEEGMLPVPGAALSLQPTKNSELALPPQSRRPRPKTDRGLQRAALEKNSGRSARGSSRRRKPGKEGPEGLGRPLKEGWTLRHHPRGAPYRPCRPTAAPGRQLPGSRPSASLAAPGQHLPKEQAFLPPPTCVRMHASQSSHFEPSCSLSPKSPRRWKRSTGNSTRG